MRWYKLYYRSLIIIDCHFSANFLMQSQTISFIFIETKSHGHPRNNHSLLSQPLRPNISQPLMSLLIGKIISPLAYPSPLFCDNLPCKEQHPLSLSNQTYWYSVPLHLWNCQKPQNQNYPHFIRWQSCWHPYKAPSMSQI